MPQKTQYYVVFVCKVSKFYTKVHDHTHLINGLIRSTNGLFEPDEGWVLGRNIILFDET